MSFLHSDDSAMGDLGYERRMSDFYPTEAWVTRALLNTCLRHDALTSFLPSKVGECIWEPAAGDDRMASVLRQEGHNVVASDLNDYGSAVVRSGVDFLETKGIMPLRCRAIVTNPPFGDTAEAFVRHALKVMMPVKGSVAMLLRHEWDCSKKRGDLFARPDYLGRIILTARPRWIDGSTGSPRHNYAWFLWSAADRTDMAPRVYYAGKK